jgi:hypothetical protein
MLFAGSYVDTYGQKSARKYEPARQNVAVPRHKFRKSQATSASIMIGTRILSLPRYSPTHQAHLIHLQARGFPLWFLLQRASFLQMFSYQC